MNEQELEEIESTTAIQPMGWPRERVVEQLRLLWEENNYLRAQRGEAIEQSQRRGEMVRGAEAEVQMLRAENERLSTLVKCYKGNNFRVVEDLQREVDELRQRLAKAKEVLGE